MAAEMDRPRAWRPPWELLSLVGLFALFLSPVIRTGYYAEDLIHSMTPGIARLDGLTLTGQISRAIRFNIAVGRFYPVTNLLHVGVHGLVRDVLAYKVLLVAGTVLDMVLFFLLVRRLTRNVGFTCLASGLTVGLIQLRDHPDPVLGYYLQVQLVTAGLFVSLIALLRFLEGGSRLWLAASAASYLLITMTYEITYPFFAAHLLLIARGRRTWTSRLLAALPTLAVVLASGLTTFLVRRYAVNQSHYVHNVDFGVAAYFTAIWHQLSAALPMSYLLGDPHSMFRSLQGVPAYARWAVQPMAVAVSMAAMGFAFRALRRPGEPDGRAGSWYASAAGLGGLLLVLPTILIATSPFHQEQFRFGVGWVPVLIECFGMGLLLLTLLWWSISLPALGGPFAPWKCVVVAASVATVTGLTYRANQDVATCLNAPKGTRDFRQQSLFHGGFGDQNRRLLESALRSGLMDPVPERSVVLLSNEYELWQAPLESFFFYATYASKVVVPFVPAAQDPSSLCHQYVMQFAKAHSVEILPGAAYRLRDVCLDQKSGYVLLWQPHRDAQTRAAGAEDGDLRLFVRRPRLFRDEKPPAFRVEVDRPPGEGKPGADRTGWASTDLTVIRSGRDWGLFSLRTGPGSVDPGSLRVDFLRR